MEAESLCSRKWLLHNGVCITITLTAVQSDCFDETLAFESEGRRKVVGKFDGGRMSSDGGSLLFREVEQKFNVIGRLAACCTDYQEPSRVEHSVPAILAQRIFALCMGYEDLNDHNRLRDDSVVALAARQDVTGAEQARIRDKSHPLAGASTLNRFELGVAESTATDRHPRIVSHFEKMDALLVALFTESYPAPPERIILDIDATDDPLHGRQEGRFYHGYYRGYCYLPLYITCGNHVTVARLRPSNIDASEGSVEELSRVVAQIRQQWPLVQILIRADGGFCRKQLKDWCEDNDLHYLLGLPRNPRLQATIAADMEAVWKQCVANGAAAGRFKSFQYCTLKSWRCAQRVVAKAEWLPGRRGYNARFVVTNLSEEHYDARHVYEYLYCARGDMENRIKEQQLALFADRTSTSMMRSNQLRLYFSTFANALMTIVKEVGLRGTQMATAQCQTFCMRLVKIATVMVVSTRRYRLSIPSAYPWPSLFTRVLANVRVFERAPMVSAPVRPPLSCGASLSPG